VPAFVRSLTQNWKLKLLAFALAVLLWVVVSAEQVTSNWIPVPLQVRVSDPQYRLIVSSVPSEVEVRFSGPGRELWDLVVRRPPLVLSVADVDSTAQVIPLDPDMVQVPTQLAVRPLDVRPGAVTLDFHRVDSRLVPVSVRVAEGPGPGYTLVDSLQVRPSRVRISGLEQDLRGIESLRTLPISLEGVDSAFNRVVSLDTAEMDGVRFGATRVRIVGRVDRLLDRSFMNTPVSVGEGIVIRPEEVSVRVRGPQSRLRDVSPEDFRVVVAIDSIPMRIPAEGILVPLRVERLPAGMRAEVTPGAVRLLPGRMFLDSVAVPRNDAPEDTARVEPGGAGG
jgi:YbbR domain-containing protein